MDPGEIYQATEHNFENSEGHALLQAFNAMNGGSFSPRIPPSIVTFLKNKCFEAEYRLIGNLHPLLLPSNALFRYGIEHFMLHTHTAAIDWGLLELFENDTSSSRKRPDQDPDSPS